MSPTTRLPRAGTLNSQKSTSSRSFPPGPHLSIPTFQPIPYCLQFDFCREDSCFPFAGRVLSVLFSLFPFPEEGNPSQTSATAPFKKRGASINISKSIAAVAGHEFARSTVGTERKSCWTCSAAQCRVLPTMGPASPFPVCVQIEEHREEEHPFAGTLEIVDTWLTRSSRQQLLGQGRCRSDAPPRSHGRGEADER